MLRVWDRRAKFGYGVFFYVDEDQIEDREAIRLPAAAASLFVFALRFVSFCECFSTLVSAHLIQG